MRSAWVVVLVPVLCRGATVALGHDTSSVPTQGRATRKLINSSADAPVWPSRVLHSAPSTAIGQSGQSVACPCDDCDVLMSLMCLVWLPGLQWVKSPLAGWPGGKLMLASRQTKLARAPMRFAGCRPGSLECCVGYDTGRGARSAARLTSPVISNFAADSLSISAVGFWKRAADG
jgi:hypothetical protein